LNQALKPLNQSQFNVGARYNIGVTFNGELIPAGWTMAIQMSPDGQKIFQLPIKAFGTAVGHPLGIELIANFNGMPLTFID
jgi:hypothetical protein